MKIGYTIGISIKNRLLKKKKTFKPDFTLKLGKAGIVHNSSIPDQKPFSHKSSF